MLCLGSSLRVSVLHVAAACVRLVFKEGSAVQSMQQVSRNSYHMCADYTSLRVAGASGGSRWVKQDDHMCSRLEPAQR